MCLGVLYGSPCTNMRLLCNLRIAMYLQKPAVMSYDLTCLDHTVDRGTKTRRGEAGFEMSADVISRREVTTLDVNLYECNCFTLLLTCWKSYCTAWFFFLHFSTCVVCWVLSLPACFNWSFKSHCQTLMKGWASLNVFPSTKQTGLYSQRE